MRIRCLARRPKRRSARCERVSCRWDKRLKPNESRRAFIRSAWLCFAASTSRSHAPRGITSRSDRSFGLWQRDPSRRHWRVAVLKAVRHPPTRKATDSGLIRSAVSAYSENGPVGAAVNPRRVRLIARRRQRLDASHPIRAQSPADRARIHRGSFWRHSFNGCRQDEDRGGVNDREPKLSRTLLSMQDLRWRALAEIRKQPGCSDVQCIAINRVTDERAENNWSLCVLSAGASDANTAARAAIFIQ